MEQQGEETDEEIRARWRSYAGEPTMASRALRVLQRRGGALTSEAIGDLLDLPHKSVSNERNQLSRALRVLVERGLVAKTPHAGLGAPATYCWASTW